MNATLRDFYSNCIGSVTRTGGESISISLSGWHYEAYEAASSARPDGEASVEWFTTNSFNLKVHALRFSHLSVTFGF
jgi:hypothetical protein